MQGIYRMTLFAWYCLFTVQMSMAVSEVLWLIGQADSNPATAVQNCSSRMTMRCAFGMPGNNKLTWFACWFDAQPSLPSLSTASSYTP